MPPEGTVLDITIKPALMNIRKAIYALSKASFRSIINPVMDILEDLPKEFKSYTEEFEKHIKTTSARFPAIEPKIEREDKFVQTFLHLNDYLNSILLHSLIIYDEKFINEIKKHTIVIEKVKFRIIEEKRKKFLIGTFTSSELNLLNDLISILENTIDEFKTDLNRIAIQISLLSQYDPIRRDSAKYNLSKEELLKKYYELLSEIEAIAYRISHDLDRIRTELRMIDGRIIKLAKTLP